MCFKSCTIIFLLQLLIAAQPVRSFSQTQTLLHNTDPVQITLAAPELITQQATKQKQIDSLLHISYFDSTICGISVYDLTSDNSLFRKQDKLLLHPASNLKLLTGITALLFLDSTACFRTKLAYAGKIEHNVLKGSLVITGGADPAFSNGDIDSLVQKTAALGIKEINGDLIGDLSFLDSLRWGNGWMWDDDPSPDVPYLSALCLNKNTITVSLKCFPDSDKFIFSTIPESHYFTFENKLLPGKKKHWNVAVSRGFANGTNCIRYQGTKGLVDTTITTTLSIYDPARFFLFFLKKRLKARNITVTGKMLLHPVTESTHLIAEINRSIQPVINEMNKNSDNLDAEMILRLTGSKTKAKNLSADDGLHYVDSLIVKSGFDPSNYRIVDGSGISHYNLVSPELLCGVLTYIYKSQPDIYTKLISTLPISGEDGTLRNRMKNTIVGNKVIAKTGTLSGVSCLSGYVQSMDSHTYAFSILLQNFTEGIGRAREIQDEICRILAE